MVVWPWLFFDFLEVPQGGGLMTTILCTIKSGSPRYPPIPEGGFQNNFVGVLQPFCSGVGLGASTLWLPQPTKGDV